MKKTQGRILLEPTKAFMAQRNPMAPAKAAWTME
jgi:hypothetical protein